jgi:hypothetical protein
LPARYFERTDEIELRVDAALLVSVDHPECRVTGVRCGKSWRPF